MPQAKLEEMSKQGHKSKSFLASIVGLLLITALNASIHAREIGANFRETRIDQFLDGVGAVLHRKFVVDPAASSETITFSCPQMELSEDAFLFAVLELLRAKGLKIEMSRDSVFVSRPSDAGAHHESSVATHVTSTKRWGAGNAKSRIRPLLSANGRIAEYAAEHILTISDSFEKIQAIRAYLGETDQGMGAKENARPNKSPRMEKIKRSPAWQALINDAAVREIFSPFPTFESDGQFAGILVFPGPNRRKFDCLGLKYGDLIVAVNDIRPNDPLIAADNLHVNVLKDSVVFTVDRAGEDGKRIESHCD